MVGVTFRPGGFADGITTEFDVLLRRSPTAKTSKMAIVVNFSRSTGQKCGWFDDLLPRVRGQRIFLSDEEIMKVLVAEGIPSDQAFLLVKAAAVIDGPR